MRTDLATRCSHFLGRRAVQGFADFRSLEQSEAKRYWQNALPVIASRKYVDGGPRIYKLENGCGGRLSSGEPDWTEVLLPNLSMLVVLQALLPASKGDFGSFCDDMKAALGCWEVAIRQISLEALLCHHREWFQAILLSRMALRSS